MKHRVKDRDGRPVAVIEEGGRVLDERLCASVAEALALRDAAFLAGAREFPADMPVAEPEPTPAPRKRSTRKKGA